MRQQLFRESEDVAGTSGRYKTAPGAKEPDDRQWQAIVSNDTSSDGVFFYAVKSTGIFCRPSCKSKPPRKENTCVFATSDEARTAGFRPCKRCRPGGQRLPDDEWISVITEYIDKHYMEPLTLEKLAGIGHGSPYHLHRTFKRIKNVTPADYIQQTRIDAAKRKLVTSDLPVSEVGQAVGMHNPSYFITLFKRKTGCTPADYRRLYQSTHGVT